MSFEKYGFKRGPFLPELQVTMYGRDREWKIITAFLNESLMGSRIRGFLIISDYGFGKTFMLNKIREAISNPKSKIENSKKTINALIVLGRTEPSRSISYEYVTKIFYNIGSIKLQNIVKKIPKKDISSFSENFQKVIIGFNNCLPEAHDWLSGTTLDAKERATLDVKTKFHPNQTLTIFFDFLRALKISGYDNLMVLIDEFEYAVNIYSENKLTALFYTFKDIYDRFNENGGNTKFSKHIQIIAMTPRGWDVVTNLEAKYKRGIGGGGITPWLDRMRFERDQVTLGPISDKAAKKLLMDRIKRVRLRHQQLSYETFPFMEPSFFDAMILVCKGRPRDLLDLSEIVLEEAIRRNLGDIGGDEVKLILSEYGLDGSFLVESTKNE